MWAPIILGLTAVVIIMRLSVVFKDKVQFFTKGFDQGFKYQEINTLWRVAKECNLDEPESLFFSVTILNQCINFLMKKAHDEGAEHSFSMESLLSRLYDFRTKVALDHENKKGLDDTRSLDKGQRLRVIWKGKGVFASQILNNGQEIVITLPKQNGVVKYTGENWIGNQISVYVWRKGDAMYSFNSKVFNAGIFQGQECIYISQGTDLRRAQKRQSIRSECKIYAQMYMITSQNIDYTKIESQEGYRCLLEDISEDGAMIRVGGKGKPNVQIKIQFELNDTVILMFGVVRSVEYSSKLNQSRLHFQCTHIDPSMKNQVLSYVYRVVNPDQIEIQEAMEQSQEDALASDSGEETESPVSNELEPDSVNEYVADDIEIK